ncbi:hypothetical protein IV203_011856 [Nitzschia inconspicua]|uniref:Uncharacterized protein n=1 Tax=Nitzschia inconspicua TaxID=303405 RepID=A0A9K3PLD4_9STRA|nr:hypothetical protein IV203_011856 [Nitzschia inconspicua]
MTLPSSPTVFASMEILPPQQASACATGNTRMDAKVRVVSTKWDYPSTTIPATIANVFRSRDFPIRH